MKNIILGHKYSQINISSDQHLRIPDMERLADTPAEKAASADRWFYQGILPPDKPQMTIWNGDTFHLYPSLRSEQPRIKSALSRLTDTMLKAGTSGDYLRIIPGNHSQLGAWPEDVLAEWTRQGIIVPDGKLSVLDPVTKITFNLRHGQEAQPAYHSTPGANNASIDKLNNTLVNAVRKTGLLNPIFPYPRLGAAISFFNAPQWRYVADNITDDNAVGVFGHTHIAEWNPGQRSFNTGFRDTLLNCMPELRLTPSSVELWRVDLQDSSRDSLRENMPMNELTRLLTCEAGKVLTQESLSRI